MSKGVTDVAGQVRSLAPRSAADRSPGVVLVVDDSSVQRDQMAALCRRVGVGTVLCAADGSEALTVLERQAQAPDAVIVDLEMPVMDGVQFIEALSRRGQRIPILVVSTQEPQLIRSVEIMARLMEMPVLAAIMKPLTEEVLRRVFVGWASQGPASSPAGHDFTPAQLAHAIDKGVIEAHYQPKVCLQTGVIRGVEVLARWMDDRLGHPPPDRFVAMAEATGQIHALTHLIVRQALDQAARWSARGLSLSMAINLSPALLPHASLVGELAAMTEAAGLSPRQIVFEITEGAMDSAPGVTLGTLNRLRMKGFGLSIDDYGTGFSSMERLALVPWSELKIDRSFVHGASRNARQRVILQSAIEMASRLNLTSVAEGVELEEDWHLLQQMGCSYAQGWFLGRAQKAGDLPAWLKQHATRLPRLRRSAGGPESLAAQEPHPTTAHAHDRALPHAPRPFTESRSPAGSRDGAAEPLESPAPAHGGTRQATAQRACSEE